MYRILLLITLILTVFDETVFAATPIFRVEAVVDKVIDGDSLHTKMLGSDSELKILLLGIVAPKLSSVEGKRAYQALKRKVLGKRINIEIYDRTSAYNMISKVYIDGYEKSINREMVAEGHAWANTKNDKRGMDSDYLAAEAEARKAKRGMWKKLDKSSGYLQKAGMLETSFGAVSNIPNAVRR